MRHQNGYTLIELLVCLSLFALLSPIAIRLIQFQIRFPDQNTLRQNQLGILQLRRYMSLGLSHEIDEDRVCMLYQDEEFCFYMHENSLIGTPGTQFFLVDLETLRFYVHDHWLILSYRSQNRDHVYHMLYNAKF